MTPFITRTGTRRLPGFPRVYRAWCQEKTAPWRRCERALVVHLPWSRSALAFGVWRTRLVDEDAYHAALGHRLTPYLDRDKEQA